jgi:hypothetical protein
MMRAALILVGVGLLVAMEVGTPPRVAKAVNQPLTQSTVGAGDPRDTLAKADRLEIPYFQNQLSAQLISFVEPTPPADSTPVISKQAGKIVGGNRHDAKTDVKTDTKTDAKSDTKTKKVASVRPKPRPRIPDSKPRPKSKPKSKPETRPDTRPKTTDSKTVANTHRSKAPMDLKPCRPNAFDSFLKALKLPSGCEA